MSLRPITVRISPQVRIARGVGVTPIPIPAVVAEAAASGDMSSADVNMRPADMSMAATGEAAEVTAGKVGTSKVAASSTVTAASTAVTAASATSESHRGNCRTAQKGSDREHRQCFSNHRGLLHRFSEH
jgi:hypothetical protein